MCFLVTGEWKRPLPGQTKLSINSSDGKFTGIDCDRNKTGEITKEQIPQDEDQSVLLRALGGYRWEPVTGTVGDLAPGDAFLLCSDGFWELVGENEMLADRLSAGSADEWAEKMLRRAAEVMSRRTGCDNLSVITVMLA